MGLFSTFSAPKNVSPTEFHSKVRTALRDKGLSERDVDHVAQVARLGLDESGSHRGLDRHEIDQTVKVLRENRDAHDLSDHQIDAVDEVFKKYL
jgi:hypothetical protein